MTAKAEIHLVRSAGPAGADLAALSAEERAGLGTLRTETARRERIAGRAIVRRRLGARHGLAPPDVPIVIALNGRPASPLGPAFSITHGGGLVAVAFAGCDVGIDLEPLVPLQDIDHLVNAFAGDAEASRIMALPRERRERAFLTMWVRKESLLKASGHGLTCDPRELDVRDDLLALDGRFWRVRTLAFATPHVGALALEDPQTPPSTVKSH